MVFWVAAALLTGLSLLAVLMPLLRGAGRSERRASYDMQVFRDQLREIDQDVARGLLTVDEAAATRAEVSRRLLAAAEAEGAEHATERAPARVSGLAGIGVLVAAVALTALVYGRIGVPGLPDQPLADRMARMAEARAERPGQLEVEAMIAVAPPPGVAVPPAPRAEDAELIARLRTVLAERPEDLRGHRILVQSLAALGQWADARAAQEQVLAILGEDAAADDYVAWAEFMILAVNGYVSPEAEGALSRALSLDPGNKLGRYYSGLALLQGGRADLAWRIWTGLLEEGPPDAPWIAAIEAEIDEVARLAGQPTRDTQRGPSAAEMQAAGAMPAEDRQAMIEGMVAQLGARLASEGGTAAEWAQLIRSLGVLGRADEARAIWEEAQGTFAEDASALDEVGSAARDAGLTQ
jgi:cytochrome c-type biogenesis protein CcmH